ncbi:surface antigen variable number repeat family protein, partial [Vibrio parahaemolyticus V-223/04]
MVAC